MTTPPTAPLAPLAPRRIAYDFAVLRVAPHPHLGAWAPVGVVVHARTAEFLRLRVLDDETALAARAPDVDVALLVRYLRACEAVCRGDAEAGAVALAPPSERFHWLTAPRSDVLHCSPVHAGLCDDPARALDRLYAEYVAR
ncbi:MAG TPA: DUF3037 domain-containing protein [Gemmatirosa sp.]|nr:DUF3037 domain-containing protein [Gemmatirosa sp.]